MFDNSAEKGGMQAAGSANAKTLFEKPDLGLFIEPLSEGDKTEFNDFYNSLSGYTVDVAAFMEALNIASGDLTKSEMLSKLGYSPEVFAGGQGVGFVMSNTDDPYDKLFVRLVKYNPALAQSGRSEYWKEAAKRSAKQAGIFRHLRDIAGVRAQKHILNMKWSRAIGDGNEDDMRQGNAREVDEYIIEIYKYEPHVFDSDVFEAMVSDEEYGKGVAYEWAGQLLETLTKMHEKGVAHRDVKPANIFLGHDGNIVLGDFGSAMWQSDVPHHDELPDDFFDSMVAGTTMLYLPAQLFFKGKEYWEKITLQGVDGYAALITFLQFRTGRDKALDCYKFPRDPDGSDGRKAQKGTPEAMQLVYLPDRILDLDHSSLSSREKFFFQTLFEGLSSGELGVGDVYREFLALRQEELNQVNQGRPDA